jgi:hypothetical protein
LSKFLQIVLYERVLDPSNKHLIANFSFFATNEVSFDHKKGIKLIIIDSTTKSIVSKFPMLIPVCSYYSSYMVESKEVINFGIGTAFVSMKKQIRITNTGHFPSNMNFCYDNHSLEFLSVIIRSKHSLSKNHFQKLLQSLKVN